MKKVIGKFLLSQGKDIVNGHIESWSSLFKIYAYLGAGIGFVVLGLLGYGLYSLVLK